MIEPTQTFSLHTATISIREKIAAERTFLTAIAISKGKKSPAIRPDVREKKKLIYSAANPAIHTWWMIGNTERTSHCSHD